MTKIDIKKINFQNNVIREFANIPLFIPAYPFLSNLYNNINDINGLENLFDNPSTILASLFIFWNKKNHDNLSVSNRKALNNEELFTKDMYSLNRNPKYTFMRSSNVAYFFLEPSLLGLGGVLSYFGMSEFLARNEELFLEGKYGDDYLTYKENTARALSEVVL